MKTIGELLREIIEETEELKKLDEETLTLAKANVMIANLLQKARNLENENDYLKSLIKEKYEDSF